MSARIVYHVARADFLERVRSYKFLIILALMIVVAYLFAPASGASYVTIDLEGYRGLYNSAWIGASFALLSFSTGPLLPWGTGRAWRPRGSTTSGNQ